MNPEAKNSIGWRIGQHESGAMVKVYMLKGSAYVLLLKAAPIRTTDGDFWGCQTVAIQKNNAPPLLVAQWDLPGGKTDHWKKEFLKLYFPREGPGKDLLQINIAKWNVESGNHAAERELMEETHGVVQAKDSKHSWTVDGGFTQNGTGLKSQTVVAMSFTKVSSVKELFFLRMQFLQKNMWAFQEYNRWAVDNPLTRANESQHWERRPEFCDMTFVTLQSLRDGIQQTSLQLKRYREDKRTQAKGVICMLTDYMGRPKPIMLRGWVAMILDGIMGEVTQAIYNEMHQ